MSEPGGQKTLVDAEIGSSHPANIHVRRSFTRHRVNPAAPPSIVNVYSDYPRTHPVVELLLRPSPPTSMNEQTSTLFHTRLLLTFIGLRQTWCSHYKHIPTANSRHPDGTSRT